MINNNYKTSRTKCSFCKYSTGRGCMATPNSYYCKEATNEYYAYLRNGKNQPTVKSFRKWDRK